MRRILLLIGLALGVVIAAAWLSMGCGMPGPKLTTVANPGGVLAAWSDADADIAGYNLYREDGSSGFAKLNATPIVAQWYQDSTAAPGTSYTYQVTAVNSAGVESDPSASATIYVP